MEAPDERVGRFLVDADGVPAPAGRGGVPGAEELVGGAALLAGNRAFELLGRAAETLGTQKRIECKGVKAEGVGG